MDCVKLIRTNVHFDVGSIYNVLAVTASVLTCYVDMLGAHAQDHTADFHRRT